MKTIHCFLDPWYPVADTPDNAKMYFHRNWMFQIFEAPYEDRTLTNNVFRKRDVEESNEETDVHVHHADNKVTVIRYRKR